MIRRNDLTQHTTSITLRRLEIPSTPSLPVTAKIQKEFLLVTTVSDVQDVGWSEPVDR